MNTDSLKTLAALAKYRNFTRTAEALYVAQSTVTNRIAELEKDVGKRLVERDRKNVHLTDEGIRFLNYANRIIELEQLALDEINTDEKYPYKLNIGTTNTIYDCYLKDKLKRFIAADNKTALKVTISHSIPLIDMLCDGVIDLAFTYARCNKNGIVCEPFKKDKMILVTDRSNTEFQSGIRLTDLPSLNYLYCSFNFQGIGEYIKELFPKHHRFLLEIDKSANLIPYLINSDSYSFLPKSLIRQELNSNQLIEIPLLDFELPKIKSFILCKAASKKVPQQVKESFINLLL